MPGRGDERADGALLARALPLRGQPGALTLDAPRRPSLAADLSNGWLSLIGGSGNSAHNHRGGQATYSGVKATGW